MNRFSCFIICNRVYVIVIELIITLIFGWFLKDIKINPDVTTYLPESDPVVKRFEYIGKQYAGSSMAMIILESNNVFDRQIIKNIGFMTEKLKIVEGVEYVTSLTNILDIKKTAEGLEISRLLNENELPESDYELQKIRNYTLAKDLYRNKIVSADGKSTLIICRLREDRDNTKVVNEIRSVCTGENIKGKLYFTGTPFQMVDIMDYIVHDLWLLTPLIIILIAITLWISFRSMRGVLLPVLSVGMGIIWTMGLMSIFKIKLTPMSDALPVVLFSVGAAYGIHVINKFNEKVRSSEIRKEQSVKALSEIGVAVFLAGITTFFGFLSFVIGSYLNIVAQFGIFSSLGVIFILFISLTFIPAVLSYLKPINQIDSKPHPGKERFQVLDNLMSKLSKLVIRHSRMVLVVTVIIIVISISGFSRIPHEVDILSYFKDNTDIRLSANFMNKEYGGSLPVQILVKGDLKSPEVLKAMKNTGLFLDSLKDVNNPQSIADLIEQMNDAMDEGMKIPDSREKIANLWFLIEGEEIMKQLVNDDQTEGIIQATMLNVDSKRIKEIENAIDKHLAEINQANFRMEKTGMQSIYRNLDVSMFRNLIQSLVLSVLLIFICMLFMLRSFKLALMGMIPLAFTIFFIFGFMGFTGVPLNIATILIASITVGAGIDYSIHFVTAYKRLIKQDYSIENAIKETLATSGKAIVINVVTIILGFLVLLFANLIPLQQFGILIAVTMFCSGFGALTILPAVFYLTKTKFVKV